MKSSWLKIAFAAAGAAAIVAAALPAQAKPKGDIRIDDVAVFPESMSAAPNGAIYIGSSKGIVYRAAPGAYWAQAWIRPTAQNGILQILGVLADAPHHTLWLCSIPSATRPGASALMAFDLKSGKQTGVYPFPSGGVCNDATVAKDGTLYVTDTSGGRILTLKRGAKDLAVFSDDARLKGIDGIAFAGDGTLYLNIVTKGQLMRVDRAKDGAATGLTELQLSQPVSAPDGMRLIAGHRFLLAEGGSGKIDEVVISGDKAEIKVLKEGLESPPAVTLVGRTAYGLEGKVNYLRDPKLKGKSPEPFLVHAIPLPKGD
jgi:streptogramin lyase